MKSKNKIKRFVASIAVLIIGLSSIIPESLCFSIEAKAESYDFILGDPEGRHQYPAASYDGVGGVEQVGADYYTCTFKVNNVNNGKTYYGACINPLLASPMSDTTYSSPIALYVLMMGLAGVAMLVSKKRRAVR